MVIYAVEVVRVPKRAGPNPHFFEDVNLQLIITRLATPCAPRLVVAKNRFGACRPGEHDASAPILLSRDLSQLASSSPFECFKRRGSLRSDYSC